MVDRLWLKQIVLNIASNSKKFVDDQTKLQISVEDSGPGIPKTKRTKLFSRFQESLDSLNQGTGMGLSLCHSLVMLMGGQISLDESFNSGIEGPPGSRFVVTLDTPPIHLDSIDLEKYKDTVHMGDLDEIEEGRRTGTVEGESCLEELGTEPAAIVTKMDMELPETLSVLVVDDDMILRKLLARSIKRVAPNWEINEAANGEAAIVMATSTRFDCIFLDQYMASAEKQLLGTETAVALRPNGVTSRICGLSANYLGEEFRTAGANSFLLKPFRCEKQALIEDLLHVLYG